MTGLYNKIEKILRPLYSLVLLNELILIWFLLLRNNNSVAQILMAIDILLVIGLLYITKYRIEQLLQSKPTLNPQK